MCRANKRRANTKLNTARHENVVWEMCTCSYWIHNFMQEGSRPEEQKRAAAGHRQIQRTKSGKRGQSGIWGSSKSKGAVTGVGNIPQGNETPDPTVKAAPPLTTSAKWGRRWAPRGGGGQGWEVAAAAVAEAAWFGGSPPQSDYTSLRITSPPALATKCKSPTVWKDPHSGSSSITDSKRAPAPPPFL